MFTAERLSDIWFEENAKYYGDSVGLPVGYRMGWSYIPHFISTRFYTYAYVFAHLSTLALYARYREVGPSFVDAYIGFLSAGRINHDPHRLRRARQHRARGRSGMDGGRYGGHPRLHPGALHVEQGLVGALEADFDGVLEGLLGLRGDLGDIDDGHGGLPVDGRPRRMSRLRENVRQSAQRGAPNATPPQRIRSPSAGPSWKVPGLTPACQESTRA